MKIAISASVAILTAATALGGDNLGFDKQCGTFKGRLQSLSMWRDYEKDTNGKVLGIQPNSEYGTSLSLQLDYITPDLGNFKAGFSYIGAGVLDSSADGTANPGAGLILNGRVNVLNEAYGQYFFTSNTTLTVGRRTNNGEIFRYTEPRHKKRSLEGIIFETKDIENTSLMVGHVRKISNLYGFNGANNFLNADFDYFGGDNDNDGVSFVEGVYTGVEKLEIAVFDAFAWDVLNLMGARLKYSLSDTLALGAHYRHESGIDDNDAHNSECYGLSVFQKVGDVKLEAGYFGVSGDTLAFEENSTGFNHSLGLLMMVDSAPYNGGADSLYLKAVTKVNTTTLYGLFCATFHDKQTFDGQEFNVVIKQPITDCLTLALKGAVGFRQNDVGEDHVQNDGRIFMTYTF